MTAGATAPAPVVFSMPRRLVGRLKKRPRAASQLYVVELFASAGGLAEGLRRAGVGVSMAFDWAEDACASYEANLGLRPVRMDVRDLKRMASNCWAANLPIDVLVADPPRASSFPVGTPLDAGDERDLLEDTVELVRLLRPRAYLIARALRFDDGPSSPLVQRTIGELARVGYCVRDFAQLDAADYGAPQHRARSFWYGHLEGPCLAWPERTHGSPAECATIPIPGTRALRTWLIDHRSREVPRHARIDESMAAIHQGFPEGWTFVGKTRRSRWEQIGTAVPPPLAEGVGRSILAALSRARSSPTAKRVAQGVPVRT